MSAEILYFRGKPSPIEQFIRVGHSGHRQLEFLHGSGRIQLPHVVIDAAQIKSQSDLMSALQESGTDIVLDTDIAELSSIGRFDGAAQKTPWANHERPLKPSDFKGRNKTKIIEQIAEFAVANNIDTVLSPSHLINGSRDEWMLIDIQSCELLRVALDEAGGKQISIDYPLIIPNSVLRDSAQRRALVKDLSDLPFDNVWIRVSGFGSDASPIGVRRFISNAADFHEIGKPIVADCVGGLAGLAVVAFGAAGGICHGVAEKERFETNSWNIRPIRKGGGGQSGRVYLPGLDRYFKIKDAELIMKAKGARRLLSCHDRDCCSLGFENMVKEPKAHFLIQRRKQLKDLEKIHVDRRVARFIDFHLTPADRVARQAARLKVNDESILKSLQKATNRLDKMRGVLEDLQLTLGPESTRSEALKPRASVQARVAVKSGDN